MTIALPKLLIPKIRTDSHSQLHALIESLDHGRGLESSKHLAISSWWDVRSGMAWAQMIDEDVSPQIQLTKECELLYTSVVTAFGMKGWEGFSIVRASTRTSFFPGFLQVICKMFMQPALQNGFVSRGFLLTIRSHATSLNSKQLLFENSLHWQA